MSQLTSGRLLVRSTVFSWFGLAAPLLIALFAVPPLISALGLERFGVLSLFWALIGYFALFDFGIGRAITNIVADLLGTEKISSIPRTLWSGLSVMAMLGLFAGTCVVVLAPWLIYSVLAIPPELRSEVVDATYVLGIAVPFVVVAAGLRGALEAAQQFGLIAIVRISFAAIALLGPLAVTPYSVSLVTMAVILLAGRILVLASLLWGVARRFPGFVMEISIGLNEIKKLLRFGAWMTLSNVISPILVNLDRFVLGAVVSMTAVTYYATPFDVVTRLLIIPAAISGVLFSAISALGSLDRERAQIIYATAYRCVGIVLTPLILGVVLFARELLSAWISGDFADHSFRVAQIIALGVLFNGLAQLPFAAIQAAKRPDLTARVHIIEFVPFILILLILTERYGAEGAAIAWLLRVALDCLALTLIASRAQSFSLTLRAFEVVAIGGIGVAVVLAFFAFQSAPRAWISGLALVSLAVLARPVVPQLRRIVS